MSDQAWYSRPILAVQTVMTEPDVVEYDAAAVVDYLVEARANCIVVNGGGIVDFFTHDGEMANPNRFGADGHWLGDLISGCHDHGIAVMARVDFRGVVKRLYDRHPDWFALSAAGEPIVLTYTQPRLYAGCYNGHHRNACAERFIASLLGQYDLDGIWHNSVHFPGACYCPTCRELFGEATGQEIPQCEGYGSDTMAAYRAWKSQCADRHLRRIRAAVKAFGDDKAYAAEIFGMYNASMPMTTGIDMYAAADHFDFLISVAFLTAGTGHPNPIGYSGGIVRFMKALDPVKQSVVLFGGNGTHHRYVKDPTTELRVWAWEAVAAGGGLWNALLHGQHPDAAPDRRTAYVAADAYGTIADNEPALANTEPVADVRIFYSKATRELVPDAFGPAALGVERVCQTNHVQYGFCTDRRFTLEALADTRLLVLPDVRCLSDVHAAMIREYVAEGGSLLATFQTSLHDEQGRRRPDFALGDLFGCSTTGEIADTRTDCYQLIRSRHEILSGFDATDMLTNDGDTLLCTAAGSADHDMICSHIPRIHPQPPEKAWAASMETDHPTIMVGQYGKGRVAYFANEVARLSRDVGHGDFCDVLAGTIRHLLGTPRIRTNAPPSVHISLLRGRDNRSRYVLSLVNLTSSPYRPIRHLVEVRDLWVQVDLEGAALTDWRSLSIQCPARVRIVDQSDRTVTVRVEVDTLDEFAAASLVVK